jgi:hypothetical protein
VIVIVPMPVILFRLTDRGTDARPCRAANNGTLQAAAEDRAQYSTTGAPDERTLTGSNPALSLLILAVVLTEAFIVAVLLMARLVILTAVSTVAETLVEIRSRTTAPRTPIISLVLRLAMRGAVGILAEAEATE